MIDNIKKQLNIPIIYNSLGDLANKMLALSASIIFASLAGVFVVESYRKDNYLVKGSNIKKGIEPLEAIEKASSTYGRFEEEVKKIDPRAE